MLWYLIVGAANIYGVSGRNAVGQATLVATIATSNSSSSSSSSSSSGRPSVKIEEIEGGAAGSGVVIGSEELETNPKTVVASIADETVGDGIPQPIVVDLEESKNGVCADESIDGVDLQYIPPTQIVMLILGTRGDVPPLVA
ncbi:predicted protein [Arabidopsis lyrata subsp. lyrata]|uniref:Predicted protein n=1 Tax=Arabidopsis lyrata subsp. lyrata TaxID=81972 RepID=D7KLH4_ARALL|nr:predicted protein [Arabidopsis lyrata subsp. lyrata]